MHSDTRASSPLILLLLFLQSPLRHTKRETSLDFKGQTDRTNKAPQQRRHLASSSVALSLVRLAV